MVLLWADLLLALRIAFQSKRSADAALARPLCGRCSNERNDSGSAGAWIIGLETRASMTRTYCWLTARPQAWPLARRTHNLIWTAANEPA
jgi:hypothetical protein